MGLQKTLAGANDGIPSALRGDLKFFANANSSVLITDVYT